MWIVHLLNRVSHICPIELRYVFFHFKIHTESFKYFLHILIKVFQHTCMILKWFKNYKIKRGHTPICMLLLMLGVCIYQLPLKSQNNFVKYFTNYIYLKYFLNFSPEMMCVIIKRGRKTISKTYSPISAPWADQTNKLLINSIFKNISKNFIG